MRRFYPGIVVAIALVMLSSGCITYLGRAKRAYAQGRYLEVSEELAQHEEDLSFLSPREDFDFGLYRGLSLMMLGDNTNARRWLAFANQVEKDNPGTMRADERAIIEHALSQLSQVSAVPAEVPSQPAVAPSEVPVQPPAP